MAELNINYYWRIIATGICFSTFSIGGLFLSTTVFPIIFLTSPKGSARQKRTQHAIQISFRMFIMMMCKLGVLRINLSGCEKLEKLQNSIIIANHPTLIDVVVIISLLKNVNCIVKKSLWNNFFLKGAVRNAGYIANDAPQYLIDDCVKLLNSGDSLIVFPEGTRTEPGKEPRFLRGAANIAIKSGKPILPIVIRCKNSGLTKKDKWYNVPKQGPLRLKFEIKDPIDAQAVIANEHRPSIATRKLNKYLLNMYFRRVLANE